MSSKANRNGYGARTKVALTLAAAVALFTLAACGSDSSDASNSNSKIDITKKIDLSAVQKDESLAAQLPASIKSSGTIKAVIDPGFPVNNYYAPDGKTIVGLSPDLLEAVGKVLGVKIDVSTGKLTSIIPALQSGRYDMAGMLLTDSAERRKVIDLVDFEKGLQELLVQDGNPKKIDSLATTCGQKVAVAEGGEPVNLLEEQSTKCLADGDKAVSILRFPEVSQALLAVKNGRADATITNFTKSEYEVEGSQGTLQLAGEPFSPGLTGWGLPKNSALTDPIVGAIDALIKQGTYAKIFTKWKLEEAQVTAAVVNGGS